MTESVNRWENTYIFHAKKKKSKQFIRILHPQGGRAQLLTVNLWAAHCHLLPKRELGHGGERESRQTLPQPADEVQRQQM